MIAVGYARISDKDQSHNSIDNQVQGITEYCTRNNLVMMKMFIDKGRSAFTFDRPEWKNLESFLKKNKQVKHLIVYHLDRFSRANLMDALIKINELENKLDVKVLTVTDPVNLDTEDLGVQILRSIGLLFSNNERQRIKERTKDGIYKSLRNGRYCSMAPFGFKNGKDHEGRPLLMVHEANAVAIRYIFDRYIKGMGIEEIRKNVIAKGFKPPKGNSAIQSILSNPLYAGMVNIPAYKGKPSEVISALHAPIVSEHDYWYVQRKLHNKTITVQKNDDVPLRGVLYCHCGAKLTAGNSRSHTGRYYWYYKCNTHKKNHAAKKLHDQFNQVLQLFSFDENTITWYRKKITEAIETKLNNKGGDIMRAKLDLSKVQAKISSVQEKFLLTPIDADVYSKVMTELKADETRLQKNIVHLNTAGKSLYAAMDLILPKLNNVRELFYTWPLHQQHLFVNMAFGYGLTYQDGVYRTPFLHPLFAHNELILKEKGLLLLQPNLKKGGVTPLSAGERSLIELLEEFAAIFAA